MTPAVAKIAGKDVRGMSIRKAKELFSEFGDDFVSELENVAHVFRDAHVRQPLPNGNFLHALCLTRVMLQHTTNSFKMLTGGAGDGFLSCLSGDFREMLQRIRSNHGKAKIIVLGEHDGDSKILAELVEEFGDCLKVAYATSKEPVRHYIIADTDMVRDEHLHEPLTEESDADSVIADVYFRNSAIADVFKDRFKRQWASATVAA